MAHLRKAQAEELLVALDSATSEPHEEIAMVRQRLVVALRIVLDTTAEWDDLIVEAAARDGWDHERRERLRSAARPDLAADPGELLVALWDLVTELAERRHLG